MDATQARAMSMGAWGALALVALAWLVAARIQEQRLVRPRRARLAEVNTLMRTVDAMTTHVGAQRTQLARMRRYDRALQAELAKPIPSAAQIAALRGHLEHVKKKTKSWRKHGVAHAFRVR